MHEALSGGNGGSLKGLLGFGANHSGTGGCVVGRSAAGRSASVISGSALGSCFAECAGAARPSVIATQRSGGFTPRGTRGSGVTRGSGPRCRGGGSCSPTPPALRGGPRTRGSSRVRVPQPPCRGTDSRSWWGAAVIVCAHGFACPGGCGCCCSSSS